MSQEKEFSLISVNEDDEVVIQAGAVPVPDEVSEEVSEELSEEPQEGSATAKPRNEYRETTLEDLEEKGPFGRMRLAILLGGIIALVIFVVSFMVMR